MIVIEKANEPPAEIKLIQELLSTEDDVELQNKINEHAAEINSELADLMNNVITQSEGKNQDVKLTEKLKSVYRAVLRFSMQKNLQN